MSQTSEHLAVEVGRLLREQKLMFAAAESCTGGLLSHYMTNVPGSSAYVAGGVVAYSNAVKHSILGIQENTLNVFGAVSEPVAAAMARGVRAVLGAQIGIGITGIAGPDGGTAEKPVGLTYIGLSTPDHSLVRRFVWDGDRITNKELSAQAALQMLFDHLHSKP
jgi:nicotinamide-nucleotide amidase